MRDRLIELIDDFIHNIDVTKWYSEEHDEGLADHLLANGVIVPPCKVGDKVYFIGAFTGQIIETVVLGIGYNENDVYLICENFTIVSVAEQLGKTVFLTREEAEARLKGEQV